MEWNVDMGPNAIFFSHSEMVPGCYLILALNFKGSGLFQAMRTAEILSAERM